MRVRCSLNAFSISIVLASSNAKLTAPFYMRHSLSDRRHFYQALRDMPSRNDAKFRMTAVSFVNELYGDESAKRTARVKGRFINNAMMATLLGDVISDALDNGKVVSGVGGQYNFVAQSFALEGARSIIMLRATPATSKDG